MAHPESDRRAREILLIKLGALGDVARTTGILGPLRRKHAPCRISWLTTRKALPLLEGLPLDRKAALGARAPRWLSRTRFDLVVCMDDDLRSARAAAATRAARRVGVYLEGGRLRYTPDSAPVFGMSLLAPDRRAADARKRANRASYPRLWARVLELRGRTAEFSPLPMPAARRGRRPRSSVVAVHAGSGRRWPSKRLPIEVAAELVRRLAQAGLKPVLVAGPGERRRNAAILRRAGAGRVAAARPLPEFGRWLAGCRALVSTDSLPMHLALAARVPCVALFGPTCRAEIETFGRGAKIGPRRPCRCFYKPVCSESSCLADLDVGEIVAMTLRVSA
ncbi:MAG TPA: glycosyltransferase family 9 protein [Elusimicrobiota bacterium]|jgi:heptosyltransferase-2|nr:glycosyltransferase family 9 protein [Elusimicrobiota bacterium]